MTEFSISLGMSAYQFIYENASQLKALPKEQRQKIANFWNHDNDGKITNEIEIAVLKGFTSKSGKVVMPSGDPTKFIKRHSGKREDYRTMPCKEMDVYVSQTNTFHKKTIQNYKNEYDQYLMKNNFKYDGEDYYDIFDVFTCRKQCGVDRKSQEVAWERETDETYYRDKLIDIDGDGIADSRVTYNSNRYNAGILTGEKKDSNLDGSYDNNKSLQEEIDRVLLSDEE